MFLNAVWDECDESAYVIEGRIDSVSNYKVIKRTDPYLDYCEINEYDTMCNVIQVSLSMT